jgi:hypothetical protein
MNDDDPTGEVRPVIDRGPPKSCRTAEHKPQDAVLRDRGGLFELSGLASRSETAHGAHSGSRHMGNVG